MALYLGNNNKKLSIKINSNKVVMNIGGATVPSMDGIKLISSDNYILKDINGVFLTAKESE